MKCFYLMTSSRSLGLESGTVLAACSWSVAQCREYIYAVKRGSSRLPRSEAGHGAEEPPLLMLLCGDAKFWSWPQGPEQMDGIIYDPWETLLKFRIKHLPTLFVPLEQNNTGDPIRLLGRPFRRRLHPHPSPHAVASLQCSLLLQNVRTAFFQLQDLKGKIWPKVFPIEAAKTMSPPQAHTYPTLNWGHSCDCWQKSYKEKLHGWVGSLWLHLQFDSIWEMSFKHGAFG